MQITSGKIAARCPLCHHTRFQRVHDKHPALSAVVMCTACGNEIEYSSLVAQVADFAVYGREAGAAPFDRA